jgi:hypothetical protein
VTGRLAKTERVDAVMLAKMGAMIGLKRQEPPSDDIVDLREFLAARRALMKDKVAAKTRRQTTTQDQNLVVGSHIMKARSILATERIRCFASPILECTNEVLSGRKAELF